MPTQLEIRVMDLLNSIELPAQAGGKIVEWGNEAVTVVCEAALGSYAGIQGKVRYTAVDLLGSLDHPQAKETVVLLLADSSADVSVRAMRVVGEQKNTAAVAQLALLLARRELPALLAFEAVQALAAIDSSQAAAALRRYMDAPADDVPHRATPLVANRLQQIR